MLNSHDFRRFYIEGEAMKVPKFIRSKRIKRPIAEHVNNNENNNENNHFMHESVAIMLTDKEFRDKYSSVK